MGEGKTVLVVDDDPDAVEFVKTVLLQIKGINVVSAFDADGALKIARTRAVDLVVLDVMMPGKSGFDAFAELRQEKRTQEMPVIMLTAVSEATGMKFTAEDMGEFIGKEPEAFLDKPVDPVQLEKTARKVLKL
jgi:DNA-binding response OmpR family regulator